MSGFLDILHIQDCVVANCPLFIKTDVSPIFILGDFYPLVLTVGMYAISLFRFEFYLFLVSSALAVNLFVNYLISKVIIQDSNRFLNCGSLHQMPSLSSDHAMFFTIVMITFVVMWRYPFVSSVRIVLLNVFFFFVLSSRIYFGINTSLELFVGALSGFIQAVLFQVFVYRWIFPAYRYCYKRYKWVRRLGITNELLEMYQIK